MLEAHRSTGIDDIGTIKWQLLLCLLGVMFLIYFALWRGIKSSGKVSIYLYKVKAPHKTIHISGFSDRW